MMVWKLSQGRIAKEVIKLQHIKEAFRTEQMEYSQTRRRLDPGDGS